jgi:hypothetical protein
MTQQSGTNDVPQITIENLQPLSTIRASLNTMFDELYGDTRRDLVIVRSADDLPAPSGGVHQLANNTYYEFEGTVTLANSLRYGTNSFVAGRHWGADVLVYTGAGAALVAENVAFNLRFMTVVAPNGAALDLSAGSSTEFLAFLAAFVGCASLGTIAGYRVPSLKSLAFDSYGAGLVFTGTSEKVLIDGCPFRDGAENSTAIHFDDDFETGAVDITGNYFKDTSATEMAVSVDAGAVISGFALFRGNLLEGGIEALSGFGPSSLGWDFAGNSGVRDSRIVGELTMDENATATALTQNVWTKVAGATDGGILERFEADTDNRLTYIGPRPIEVMVTAVGTILGSANGQLIEKAIYRNGTTQVTVPMTSALTGPASSRSDTISVVGLVLMEPGDYVELWMRCTSGSNNATVQSLQMVVSG